MEVTSQMDERFALDLLIIGFEFERIEPENTEGGARILRAALARKRNCNRLSLRARGEVKCHFWPTVLIG